MCTEFHPLIGQKVWWEKRKNKRHDGASTGDFTAGLDPDTNQSRSLAASLISESCHFSAARHLSTVDVASLA